MLIWEYKAARVHLSDSSHPNHNISVPTDRRYWLIVMRQPATGEVKYVISNAGEGASVEELIRVLLSRWHVEKWFERAKQDAGLGAFEVRTYVSLIRHWLCVRLAMCFLSEQATRLRGKNVQITFEQVCEAVSTLAAKIWQRDWRSWSQLMQRCAYHQQRNTAAYKSRHRSQIHVNSS